MATPKPFSLFLFLVPFALLALAGNFPNAEAKPPKKAKKPIATGAQVWQAQCAACHGAKGEGTEAYGRALTGDKSVGQLAKYIASQMPPGPKKCSVADSSKVASYIFGQFYSPLAQERNRPARVSLSRLTAQQMRNAVADTIGAFRPAFTETAERGLSAEYFKAKRFAQEDRIVQRIDPEVSFDFGTMGPTGGEFNPHQFSLKWSGSVVAPDTGMYEFVVKTEHGIRVWVNDMKKPLIDREIKSGNDTEYRGSVYLLGGRAYPIRVQFSKSTTGVDDTKKKEGTPAPKASIVLLWKRPKQVEEIIPSRALLPQSAPETFVVTSPLPPDDRSMGYERGDSVSKAWDEATTAVALETAEYVAKNRRDLTGSLDEAAKFEAFARKFVERALRRPLDAETEQLYIKKQFAASPDPQIALKRVVLLTLKSPRFLYRELGGETDAYGTASRLSFSLWDSLPDETLLAAASSGKLSTQAEITAQAERMASDGRAWHKQREFLYQWLKIDQYPDLAKDAKRFPNFSPAAASDLRTSLDLTMESVVKSERADFRELLLTDKVYLNGRLASVYGAKMPVNAPFQPVALDANARAGVLTHPYVLASFAYHGTSSPIHRGVLLTRSVMGRTLSPPPAAFTPLDANLHPKLTTRQRVTMQTKPAACSSCHSVINPLGFTMERFDAIGRLRSTENGSPVDVRGSYVTKTGETVKFNGARDLARYVAGSGEAHTAFVEKLFQHNVKQPIRAYGPQTLPSLKTDFEKNGYNIRRLSAQIAVRAALPRKK